MRSSIVGALIGGFCGRMARDSNNLSDLLVFDNQLLVGYTGEDFIKSIFE